MTTDTDICNLALSRIAVTTYISSLDEIVGKEARTCRLMYAMTRDRVLEAYNWPFARKEADLQDVGTPPQGWAYRYRYPGDCVKVRQVGVEGQRNAATEIPFIVMEDEAQGSKAIACDISPAVIIYTKRITSTALFTPSFVNSFAWLMASELVLPFAKDPKLITYCFNAYTQALHDAANLSANGQREDLKPTDSYISARS